MEIEGFRGKGHCGILPNFLIKHYEKRVENMENRVRLKRRGIVNSMVGEEIGKIILDTSYSKGSQSKYTKTFNIY
jgi:hypothetical protein